MATRPNATSNVGAANKSARKFTKSETDVVMLENVMHDKVLYSKGDRVTLLPDVFSLFVSNKWAAAVDVSVSDSDTQSQKLADNGEAKTEAGDKNPADVAPSTSASGEAGDDANKKA